MKKMTYVNIMTTCFGTRPLPGLFHVNACPIQGMTARSKVLLYTEHGYPALLSKGYPRRYSKKEKKRKEETKGHRKRKMQQIEEDSSKTTGNA